MVFRRHAQGLHRHLLQSKQQFGPVRQEQIHIRSLELQGYLGAFIFRVDRLGFHQIVVQCKAGPLQQGAQELHQAWTYRIDGIFLRATQRSFPAVFLFDHLDRLGRIRRNPCPVKEPLLGDVYHVAS